MFLSIDDVLTDEAVVSGDPLPYSYILNYLFSRAPSEMRSPHQVGHVTCCYGGHPGGIYHYDYRFRNGLRRSILIGWINTLRKMTDSSSFSELFVYALSGHA